MCRKAAIAALFAILIAPVLKAGDPCPCIPTTHLWTIKSCETWDCASTAIDPGKGDPNVFVMASGSDQHPWLVFKRVVAGTAAQSADGSFVIEQFPKMLDGSLRFDSIDGAQQPMLVTTFDHAVLVVYLKDAPLHRRSAGH